MPKVPESRSGYAVDWGKVGQWVIDLVKAFRGGPGRFYAFTFAAGMVAITGAQWWAPILENFVEAFLEWVMQGAQIELEGKPPNIPPLFIASSGLVICLLSMLGFHKVQERQLQMLQDKSIGLAGDYSPTDVDIKIESTSDLQSLIKAAIDALSSVTETDYNQFFLISTQSHSKQLICVGRKIAKGKQDYRIAAFSGLLGNSISSGRLINVPDVREWVNYMQAVLQTRSELVVPIKIEGRIVGVLNSESEVANHFTADHEGAVTNLANAIGRNLHRVGWREDLDADELPYLGVGHVGTSLPPTKKHRPFDCPKCHQGFLVSISEFTKASEGTFTRHYTTKQCSNCGELIVT